MSSTGKAVIFHAVHDWRKSSCSSRYGIGRQENQLAGTAVLFSLLLVRSDMGTKRKPVMNPKLFTSGSDTVLNFLTERDLVSDLGGEQFWILPYPDSKIVDPNPTGSEIILSFVFN